jgi:small-conductance mechanosensitive channel
MNFLIQYDIPLYSISLATAFITLIVRDRMEGKTGTHNRLLLLAILFVGASLAAIVTMQLRTIDFSVAVTRSIIDEIAIVITWLLLPVAQKEKKP